MQAEAPWLIAYLVLNYILPFTLNLLILCRWGVTQIFFQGWVCCPTVSFCRAWPVREPIWPKAHGLPGMACTPWPFWPPRDTLVGTLCLRSLPSQPKTHWVCIKFTVFLCPDLLPPCYGQSVCVPSKAICWNQIPGWWYLQVGLWEVTRLWRWSPHEWD